jgi:hypothetical protein
MAIALVPLPAGRWHPRRCGDSLPAMAGRTFAIGDIHGELDHLRTLLSRLPDVGRGDTVVFMGDYVDRGPASRQVVEVVRGLDRDVGCNVVCLRGNHEDAWLKVVDEGWPGFVMPPGNGCLATMRSYTGGGMDGPRSKEELLSLLTGRFFPDETIAWFRSLQLWYEDEHAIYVHAGLCIDDEGEVPPSRATPSSPRRCSGRAPRPSSATTAASAWWSATRTPWSCRRNSRPTPSTTRRTSGRAPRWWPSTRAAAAKASSPPSSCRR